MRQIEQVKERIESESVPKEGPAYQRILAAMDRGDVDTAHEYIDLGLRNDELPAPVEQVNDTFNNFYPKATSELEKFSRRQPPNLAAFVENGKVSLGRHALYTRRATGRSCRNARCLVCYEASQARPDRTIGHSLSGSV